LWMTLILFSSFSLARAQDCADYRCPKEPRRFALVIGNSNYTNLTSIPSAAVDAEQVSQKLKELGFDVEAHYDVRTRYQFWEEIYPAFRQKLTTGDFIVFYFSGHGFSNGANSYLAPSELPLSIPEQTVTDYAIAVQSFRSSLEGFSPALILFIVDACLSVGNLKIVDDKNHNTVTKGPGPMDEEFKETNALIVYATQPGKEAQGTTEAGRPSPFTGKLVANITAKGTPFLTVFRQAASQLASSTNPQQIAHTFLSSRTDPYLNPTEQNVKDDEESWISTLEAPTRLKVDVFAQMNSVGRYLTAAKRWLAEHQESDLVNSTSQVSPIAIDRAWHDANTEAAALRRLSVPLAFTRSQDKNLQPELRELSNAELGLVKSGTKPIEIAQLRTGEDFVATIAPNNTILRTELFANSLAYSLATINASEIMVTTSSLIGRAQPRSTAKVIENIRAKTPLRILEVSIDSDASPWIKAMKPDNDSPFFFTFKPSATPAALELGRSALEILVPARPDSLPVLVDPSPIKEAISKLKAEGWRITWISLSTAASNDEKDQRLRLARLTNAEYILRHSDIPGVSGSELRKRITSVAGTEDFSGDSVRIRFFGIKAN